MVIDLVPIWAVLVLTVATVLAAFEMGFLSGKRRRQIADQEPEGPLGAMVAATLGLLAFVLAFTFGMAESRYNMRKQLVVAEANAIGTTYLRSRFLPEADAKEVQVRLREYVAVRLDAAEHPENFSTALERSEALQKLLWAKAVAAGQREPNAITGLFVGSLNEVIDIHGERMAAVRNRLPMSIWVAVYLMAILGLSGMGYHAGLTGAKRSLATLTMTLAFSGILVLITDLDRPQEGSLRVSQQAMMDVQKTIQDPTDAVGR